MTTIIRAAEHHAPVVLRGLGDLLSALWSVAGSPLVQLAAQWVMGQ